MYSYLRVSNAGNLIRRTYNAQAARWDVDVVLDTSGMGDRRVRKAAARAELAARTRVYADIRWHTTSPGALHRVGPMEITLKV